MWINKYLAFLSVAPILVFGAENTGKHSKNADKKTPEVKAEAPARPLTKKEKEALVRELSMAASRFNPRQPGLTVAHVQKVLLKDVFDPLIGKKIPEEPSKIKKAADTITYLGARVVIFKYEILLKNPELPEVTGIHPAWFKAYGQRLKKFEELAKALDSAVANRDMEKYTKTRLQIESYQKSTKEFAEGKKPKLSGDALRALRRKNMSWRTAEFKKNQLEKLKKAGITPAEWRNSSGKKVDDRKAPAKKRPNRRPNKPRR